MNKNDIVTVTISDMSHSGEGIGKVNGFPLFIKDAIIGDVVNAKIMKLKKNYGFARLMEIVTPSSDRDMNPVCPNYKRCGGCQIMAMNYDAQLKYKENLIKNNLIRIGGMDESIVDIMEPIIGMDNPYRYRNKAQYPIGKNKEGEIIAGFYAGRTHDIMECDDCYLGVEENKLILTDIKEYMANNNVEPYDEITGKGLVRHVLIRKGFKTGEFMVCLIINGDSLPNYKELQEKLEEDVPGLKSLFINVNKKNTNVIMGDTCKKLWGEDYIIEELDGIRYRISPLSFFQVNPIQTEKLYNKALEYANLTGKENVWDLYCGAGSISLFLAKKAAMVHGVEIVEPAIVDARNNACDNGITNVEFFVGAAEDVFDEEMNRGAKRPDVVVVDPPRKGCDEKLLRTMLKMAPDRIVYVSCDSATLARDLKILCEKDYKLEKWCGVDQFSHTVHCESVCLLSKVESRGGLTR